MIPSDEELEADKSAGPAESIDEVITNHLVLFCSILMLQAQEPEVAQHHS
jgi:nucleoprotein TPR